MLESAVVRHAHGPGDGRRDRALRAPAGDAPNRALDRRQSHDSRRVGGDHCRPAPALRRVGLHGAFCGRRHGRHRLARRRSLLDRLQDRPPGHIRDLGRSLGWRRRRRPRTPRLLRPQWL
eukprot:Amastigsp_a842952_4.p5 type:complete len:120 gc:universal Amastigsp_a842952_4:640-281(-)